MVYGIQPIGLCSSVNTDIFSKNLQKSYFDKKEMAIFKEDIKICPTIYHGIANETTETANTDEDKLLQSRGCDDIQYDLSSKKSAKNNIDDENADLFERLMESLEEEEEEEDTDIDGEFSIKTDLPKFLNGQKLGPPYGLEIENFDYWATQ